MAEPASFPSFSSGIIYLNDRAAIEWLEKAFGFEVSLIVTDDSGAIGHAEMKFGNGIIYVGREWSDITRSPKSVGEKNTQQVHVHLESGIDAHFERARKAGARIVQEPEDQFYGDRTYRCLDLEGHLWTFGQTVKTLSFEEMEKATGNKLKLREKL